MAIRPRTSARGIAGTWPVAALGSVLPVVDAAPPSALTAEIDTLPQRQRLIDNGSFHVYWACASQIHCVLQEIGRLRELTFRSVGEGSGKCSDLDEFDRYYLHLFVWDAQANAIVGAYRLGLVEEILARYGKRGLYTHSLFRYGPRILHTLKPAIELGRSFVRVEYQRSFAPMLLLWRGIGRFVESNPQYAVLIGAVSISNSYSPASRELMVEYLSEHMAEAGMVTQVRPRRPFRSERRSPADQSVSCPATIDELSRMIEQLEPDRKGVPVLLRQYVRLGARMLAFSVDGNFGNVLDGLMVADLREVEPSLLARYMGASGMRTFRAYHGLDREPAAAPAVLARRRGSCARGERAEWVE